MGPDLEIRQRIQIDIIRPIRVDHTKFEGAQTHNQSDIYVLILCYDAFGSVITDNIGYMQMFHELQYKDP